MATLGRPKRSDLATEADWSFLTNETEAQIRKVATAAAKRFRQLDADDTFQEICIYLAVRPGVRGNESFMEARMWRICQNLARQSREYERRHPSYEDMFNEEEEN